MYWIGEWCLVSVPSSWENRSFLTGEGDSRYYGCLRNGVKDASRLVATVYLKGEYKSLAST